MAIRRKCHSSVIKRHNVCLEGMNAYLDRQFAAQSHWSGAGPEREKRYVRT